MVSQIKGLSVYYQKHQHKHRTAVGAGGVGEFPNCAQADGRASSRQNKADFRRPGSRGFHKTAIIQNDSEWRDFNKNKHPNRRLNCTATVLRSFPARIGGHTVSADECFLYL